MTTPPDTDMPFPGGTDGLLQCLRHLPSRGMTFLNLDGTLRLRLRFRAHDAATCTTEYAVTVHGADPLGGLDDVLEADVPDLAFQADRLLDSVTATFVDAAWATDAQEASRELSLSLALARLMTAWRTVPCACGARLCDRSVGVCANCLARGLGRGFLDAPVSLLAHATGATVRAVVDVVLASARDEASLAQLNDRAALCPVCETRRDVQLVFLCGHSVCGRCASHMLQRRTCPVCSVPVTGATRVFT